MCGLAEPPQPALCSFRGLSAFSGRQTLSHSFSLKGPILAQSEKAHVQLFLCKENSLPLLSLLPYVFLACFNCFNGVLVVAHIICSAVCCSSCVSVWCMPGFRVLFVNFFYKLQIFYTLIVKLLLYNNNNTVSLSPVKQTFILASCR